jgi:hypothetical protein
MAWTYNTTVIRAGRSWTNDDGIKHPSNWGSWSEEEKTAAGLVWVDDPAPFDPRFYWAADVPKALDDVHEVDEDGELAYGPDGNPVITLGLKSQEKAKAKAQAGDLLASTDWYVTRNAEKAVAVPVGVGLYREEVRNEEKAIEATVDAVTTHDEFMELFKSTEDTPAVVPNWPNTNLVDLEYADLTEEQHAVWRTTAKVSMRQARLALIQEGYIAQIEEALALIPDPDKTKVETEWQYSSVVERDSQWVAALQPALGLTDQQLDDLFILAATL